MMTDADLTPIDLAEFWEDEGTDTTSTIEPDYIKRHIDRIPKYGDDSRYRLASHLDMFENLSPDGSLTPEQRQAVDNFAIGYQYQSDPDECEGCEMDFPECQYVALGLDLGNAIELGDSWRRGEFLPDIGHPAGDRLTARLNQMTNQPIALDK